MAGNGTNGNGTNGNKRSLPQVGEDPVANLPSIDGFPASEKVYVEAEGLRLTKARTMTKLSRGETPGPEASIAKLVGGVKQQEIGSFGADLLEQAGAVLDSKALPGHGLFQQAFLAAPGIRIAGGTDEILRNIIAERVLGLPGDIRVDRDRPYNEIPSGKA